MKRKINEAFDEPVVIVASKIRRDDATVDCNDLKEVFVDAGAEVDGEYVDGETHMIVRGLSKEEIVDILDDYLADTDCMFAKDYILEDILEEKRALKLKSKRALHECGGRQKYQRVIDVEDECEEISEDEEFPKFEDVEVEDEDMESLNSSDYPDYEEADAEEQDLADKAYNALVAACNLGDNVTEDYIDQCAYELIEEMGVDPDDLADDEYDHYLDVLKQVYKDNEEDFVDYEDYDDVDIDDEDDELPSFEKMGRHGRLEEKRRGCCPKKPAVNEGLQAVLRDLDKNSVAKKATEKLLNENLKAKTKNALKFNKKSLHENVKVNGKSLKEYSIEELKSLYAKLVESVESLSAKTLNESVNKDIEKRNRLMEFIDEEITYRQARAKYINEDDSSTISDEELSNLFGPAQGDSDEKTEESDEETEEKSEESEEKTEESEDEEVELSRIEITLKDADALKDLKDACIEAEIPEDAFECVGLEEESEEDEDIFGEDSDEDEEENEESEEKEESDEKEKSEESEEKSEDANESVYYHNISRLFEDDAESNEADSEEGEADAAADEEPEEHDEEEDAESDEEKKEDEEYKFILTNTDYASALAKVLEDVYGISKEEFEEMIGGEIVEEGSKEDEDSEKSEEDKEESSEDKEEKEDKEKKDEEDDDDDIDPSELFKGL